MPLQRLVRGKLIDLDPQEEAEVTAEWLAAEAQQMATIQQELIDAVQAHMDAAARELGYDSVFTAATYATSDHPRFGTEGRAFVVWRDAVWQKCYELLGEVQSGKRAIPSAVELITLLPAANLPT